MRYMLLIGNDDKNAPPPTKAQMDAMIQGHMRFGEELHAAGKMVVGERLRPDTDASRIRVKAGHRQVMDGPFAETKEALGGFYLIECAPRRKPSSGQRRSRSAMAASSTCGRSGRCSIAPADHVCAGGHRVHRLGSGRHPSRSRPTHSAVAEVFRLEYARLVASVLPDRARYRRGGGGRPGGLRAGARPAGPPSACPIGPGAWLLTDGAAASARSPPPQPAGRGPRRRRSPTRRRSARPTRDPT